MSSCSVLCRAKCRDEEVSLLRVAISSGHGLQVSGAVGILNELHENRRVVDRLVEIIDAMPGCSTAVWRHDTHSTTVAQNVNQTVAWHRAQQRDRDVQIHFNAFERTPGPRGTEVLFRVALDRALAARVSSAVARAGGLRDRGPVQRSNLGWLNGLTVVPAIMPEIAFVDSDADVALYRRNFEAICQALATAITS